MPHREQRPPVNEVQRIEVARERSGDDPLDWETATIRYYRGEDAWYVRTPENSDFWKFAQESARDVDVRQLINKKWNARYGEPDPLDDRS